jgi:hypothetical protein
LKTDPLAGYLTLRDITPRVGSYSTAYSLAAAGQFGPAVVVGRTHLFCRSTTERAIEKRAAAKVARR